VVRAGPASVTSQQAATFSFGGDAFGSNTGARLECALDDGPFEACSSPQAYSGLGEGGHMFRVRATGVDGAVGPTTEADWTIDVTAPTAPQNPQAASTSQTSVSLGWTASTDNLGVTAYTVLRDGVEAGTTATTALTVGGLTGCTTYTFTVAARDAAGNASAASHLLTVTTAGCPIAASVFVAPGGSDVAGNACSTAASPCETFAAAFDRAAAGSVVEVAGGTYASQDISGDRGGLVTFRPAAGATVTMGGTLFIGGTKHLKLVGFHFPRSDPNWELALEPCNNDITLESSTGRRFFILEGNSNITFRGGSWGGYATPDDEDSGIGTSNGAGVADPAGLATCAGTTAGPASNILFDGVTFHDVFWNPDLPCTDSATTCALPFGITCSSAIGTCGDGWGASHPDCLEINGYVNGVTIENSTFVHCGNTMLALYTDQGNIDNVIVRNNTFRDMAPTSYYGMQWTDTTEGFTCSGDKFLNNTYTPNAPGAWFANTPPRFECNLASGGIPTEVAGNNFQEAPQSQDCVRSKTSDPAYTPAHVYNTNWHDNVYQVVTVDEMACANP
jgi:chitodextrinase